MNKSGRPSKKIDPTQLRMLMRLKPTLEDTAAFFECSHKTIERMVRKNFKTSFVQFRDQNMVHTRLNIVRKAIQKAESGDNTMLIFCLKNLCDWQDNIKHDHSVVRDVVIKIGWEDDPSPTPEKDATPTEVRSEPKKIQS